MSSSLTSWLGRPHRRLNPLTGEWVLVSPQRMDRPWLGERSEVPATQSITYDPACYLCPGNKRANGYTNPPYDGTFVFDNDFPSVSPANVSGRLDQNGVMVATSERGIARVICFSPRHDLSIPTMPLDAIGDVVDVWRDQTRELSAVPFIRSVQIFENRGSVMGASNPHPHCQIWATESIPTHITREDRFQHRHWLAQKCCLLCDYWKLERTSERIIHQNASFVCLVPFWATWPFETLILPTRHLENLGALSGIEIQHLAAILRQITATYDVLFRAPFPYTMGFHQRPKGAETASEAWHLHAHFYPPLLRSATIRKFMVGFELLGESQRDLTPEAAAAQLRAVKV